MPFNVNPKSIERYLQDLAHGEDSYDDNFRNLEFCLHTALYRSLCRELTNQSTPQNLSPVRTPHAFDPKWVSEALAGGRLVYNFAPDTDLQRKLGHVTDWLYASEQQRSHWLSRRDKLGRPYKLLKIGSIDQAVREADKAMNRGISQTAIALGPEDFRTVQKYPDGARVDQLLTERALDAESTAMRHCIGLGAYDDKLTAGTHSYFSLRSASGKPCVTMEVRHADNMLIQCQGRGNQLPTEKYRAYIQDFVRDRGFNLDNPLDTGLIKNRGCYYDIHNLPENYSHDGDLDLSGTTVTRLPDGLDVSGSLILRYTPISALPNRMSVAHDIDVAFSKVTSLPENLHVPGRLVAQETPLEKLPRGLRVRDSLNISQTDIAQLPPDLRVGSTLNASGTPLEKIPATVHIGGSLVLRHTMVRTLPSRLHIPGSLDLTCTPITELPCKLIVGQDLTLFSTDVGNLPQDIKIGRDLTVDRTPLRTLPPDLHVPGNLSAAGSRIETLPPGLVVGKSLCLRGTPIKTLPPDLNIGVSLNLYACNLDSLPEALTIPDSINLSDASVAKLPHRMEIGRHVHINSGTRLPHMPSYFCGRVQRPVTYAGPAPASAPRTAGNSKLYYETEME